VAVCGDAYALLRMWRRWLRISGFSGSADPAKAYPEEEENMTGKTIRELALDAIDQALAESIRQQFIGMALADPTEDGGIPLAVKRFKRCLPQIADLHKRARAIVADAFKEELNG